jgi:hypothetical protein
MHLVVCLTNGKHAQSKLARYSPESRSFPSPPQQVLHHPRIFPKEPEHPKCLAALGRNATAKCGPSCTARCCNGHDRTCCPSSLSCVDVRVHVRCESIPRQDDMKRPERCWCPRCHRRCSGSCRQLCHRLQWRAHRSFLDDFLPSS